MKLVPEILNEIKILFNKNLGSRKIAKLLKVNRSTVLKAYKVLNLDGKSKSVPRFAHLISEKFCKNCDIMKPVLFFRKRTGKYKDASSRISYESLCLDCEYIYNKEKAKVKSKKLRKTNINFALRKNISYSIWKCLQRNNSSKDKSCMKYLNYTIIQLRENLENKFESWMTWNNYGKYNKKNWDDNNKLTWTWQLDHIIPQSDLQYSSMTDNNFKKCWSLDNLRPLSSKQNLLDGVNKLRHKKI